MHKRGNQQLVNAIIILRTLCCLLSDCIFYSNLCFKCVNMASVEATLDLARQLLHGHGGEKAALSLLEKRTQEDVDVYSSAAVWACIAQLRLSLGLSTEAKHAMERASLLRTAPSRKISFDSEDHVRSPPYMKHFAEISPKRSTSSTRRLSTLPRTAGGTTPLPHLVSPTGDTHLSKKLACVHKTSARCREILSSADSTCVYAAVDPKAEDMKERPREDGFGQQGHRSAVQARVDRLKSLREWTSDLLKILD